MIGTDKTETFWQQFDKLVAAQATPLTPADKAFAQTFKQQVKDIGCAVVDTPPIDLEGAAYAKLRAEWVKLCRGDTKMEAKFSKVALMLEIAMQPLADELELVRRRLDVALDRLRAQGI